VHVNEQVRDAFETRLLGVTQISSVFTNRGPDITDSQLPAAVIGSPSDSVELQSKGSSTTRPLERREIEIDVVIIADGDSETLDEDLDDLRASAEAAIGSDDDLGGLARDIQHTGADLDMGVDDQGERWYAFLAMTWTVEVWTRKGDPETAR